MRQLIGGRKQNKGDYLVKGYQKERGVRMEDGSNWGKTKQGTMIHVWKNTITKLLIVGIMLLCTE